MWIRRLAVENFSGIQSASLELRPGLNVFYGPNELGKSSLVHAIRAALLLQDGSSSAGPLVDWHADAPPTVTLELETEQQRIWRIRKSFGKSFGSARAGFSYLEFSRDGQTFTQEAKGREVDGRLHDLLQWGLAPPGGRGGGRKRGIPESFITTALLGEQDEVVKILESSLEQDPDESGRQRLTGALQAMAEDPLFRRILDETQAKFDEAFTGTGRRRGGKSSPWIRLRDDVQSAKRRTAEVQAQLEQSEAARLKIGDLQRELLAAQVEADSAAGEERRTVQDLERREARRVAEAALAEAFAEVARVEQLHALVRETELGLLRHRADVKERVTALEAAEKARAVAATRVEEARARVRELESGAGEQQRKLREQEIEKLLLGLEARQKDLAVRIEQAERVGELSKRLDEHGADIAKRERTIAEARELLGRARSSFARDREALERLEERAGVARYLAARDASRAADEALSAARASTAEAERLEARADEIRREVDGLHLPRAETVAELRGLETEWRVAGEKLEVGLTLTLAPDVDTALAASIDGEEQTAHAARGARTELEAKGLIRLRLPEFGEIEVRGGTRDLHAAAEASRARFEAAAEPIFAETGCSTVHDLEALQQRARERLREVQPIEAQAAAARARAEGSAQLEARRKAARADLARIEAALRENLPGGTSLDALVRDCDSGALEGPKGSSVDAAETGAEIEKLSNAVEKRKELVARLELEVSRDEGRLESRREERAALERDRDRAREGLDREWSVALEHARSLRLEVIAEREERLREIEAIRTEATTEVDEARSQLEKSEVALAEAKQGCDRASQAVDAARTSVARLEGELATRREAALREDPTVAAARAEERAAALEALPEPEREVDEALREQASKRRSDSADSVRRIELALREAEGALAQVGGQYIEEQVDQAREALEAASEHEREVDIDYGAWSLLLDTLKEAGSEDAVHLGNALVEPIARRMSALTDGRYGSVTLEPQLETRGIELGGAERSHESLSIGTQEQLATMLRLSIAEALGSFLVLDDHLTQSDPARMGSLRDLLRRAAEGIQIVVFTCRPGDYLTPEETAGGAASAGVRAIDLRERVTRSFSAPGAGGRARAPVAESPAPKREPSATAPAETRPPEQAADVSDLMAELRDSLKGEE